LAAYCEPEDVKARAGVLKDAWGETTRVNNADLERFIRDASSTVDVAMAAHGYTAPATDELVVAALTPVVADMALLTALEATWPGGSGPAAVSDLIADVRGRVEGYVKALADGEVGFLIYLKDKGGSASGASSFWTSPSDYRAWLTEPSRFIYRDRATGALIVDESVIPTFSKGMKL
jgi:hypothetical protein